MANPILRNCTEFNEKVKYIEADANYSVIHWVNHRPEMFSKTLKRYEEQLPGWLRISRVHLVNPLFIRAATTAGTVNMLHLIDGKTIPISRSKALRVKIFLTKRKHV